MKYRMYGDIVQLIRYVVAYETTETSYGEQGEPITQTIQLEEGCISDAHRDAFIASLNGAPYTVETVDQAGNEWIDGLEFPDAKKADEAFAKGEGWHRIEEYKNQLQTIDAESGASRHVRDVSVSAGVVLNAVRVLISRFAKELEIGLPAGFGAGCASAVDILALQPPSGASPEEAGDFAVFKALLLVSYFDPAINPGLTKMSEAEYAAAPIREQLAALEAAE